MSVEVPDRCSTGYYEVGSGEQEGSVPKEHENMQVDLLP